MQGQLTAIKRAMPNARAGIAWPVLLRERLLALGGLGALVLIAATLRALPILLHPSINWWDEIFQTVEPAHRLVFGYGLVTWEYQVGMRSWLFPGALAGLIEVSRIFGDAPQTYLAVIAAALALLASVPVVCCFCWCCRSFGPVPGFVAAFAIAVAPEMVYFGARALNEVVAAHLLVIAAYLLFSGEPRPNRRGLVIAGALLALVCLLRPQLAPAVAVLALWPAAGWRCRLPSFLLGGLLTAGFGAAVDWVSLGYPFASVWRNVYDNLYLGVSSDFSVKPWFFYLAGELGVWLEAAPILVLLAWLGAGRLPGIAAAMLTVVAVHSLIGHKEYRFIYPAVALAMVLASVGLAEAAAWLGPWLWRRGFRPAFAAGIAAVLVAGGWGTAAWTTWSRGPLAMLRERAHDELVAMSFVRGLPDLCGIGLAGDEAWVRYGGYTYLHRPLPMYWAKSEPALAAATGAFNVLLYEGEAPLPPGYAPVRCFGAICAARRQGRCEPRPMPAMWYPQTLQATTPDPQHFEAVPSSPPGAQ